MEEYMYVLSPDSLLEDDASPFFHYDEQHKILSNADLP